MNKLLLKANRSRIRNTYSLQLKNGSNKLECLSLARNFSALKCKALALWAHSKDNVNMAAEVTDVSNFAP